jgi:hypothetical protein
VTRTKGSEPKPDTRLSPYRSFLARGQRPRQTDAIFAAPDPPAAIRALPPDEFFYLVHELGFPEAMEIFVHGVAEQIQAVLDFSIWDRDRIALANSDEWLAALVEAPPETLGRWAEGIDVELLALLVRKRARIYDLSLEDVPETPQGILWDSPDRLFTIDLLGDPDQVRVTQRLLDSLYRYSPTMMRRLLVGMRGETDADLEEEAFRWRSGRMADLGFADYFEALQVYQELDPASVHVGETPVPRMRPADAPANGGDQLRLPTLMAERMAGETPFARAVATLPTRQEVAELHFSLVALCNRALAANRVTPSDEDAIREVLGRVSATLDLAVEFLARGDAKLETSAVRTVPLLRLHRLGTSLVGKLRRLALSLRRGNRFACLAPALDIFQDDDRQVLQSLARPHPLFPKLLDAPPAPGERPFACLADLATATRAVERAAASLELLHGLGVAPGHLSPESLAAMAQGQAAGAFDPAAIDADVLARTVLVGRLLDQPPAPLAALSKEAIASFKLNFNNGSQLSEMAAYRAFGLLRAASPTGGLQGAALEVASRWVLSLCPLAPVLGAYDPT